MSQGLSKFIASLEREEGVAGETVHVEKIPPRPQSLAAPQKPLPEALSRALKALGVNRLYSHQAQALDLARAGRDLVVATPTASGKTLVYALPVLEGLINHPQAKALFLFPLKALEQDQLAALNQLAFSAGLGEVAAVYDGDTPPAKRRRLRENPPGILISNPDMVHAGICAFAPAWEAWLQDLRYVVIDEVHTYRGVFGCHVAQVLRRLMRLARGQGSQPSFILSSATIANPREHAQALCGRKFSKEQVIAECGAPAAGRFFALLNPHGAATTTASRIFTQAVRQGLSTICFTKSRLYTELIHTWVTRSNPDLREKIAGYRAGFLPEERRRIEADLASGALAGVVSTSALEMGIDIGELDVCILVGYPGSQINTWQRGGRVGRAGRESAIFLVAAPDALDQYFLAHPQRFFARPVEAAVLDPENSHIVKRHLVCAAAEEALGPEEGFFDLKRHSESLEQLLAEGELLLDAEGAKYFAARKRPQRFVDLRGSGESYAILDPKGKVVGSLDGVRVFKEGYPGAVYLHQTRSYIVRNLDLEHRRVQVQAARADYYTRARSEKETEILEETGRRLVVNFLVRQGRLKVTETVTGYERRRLRGGDLLGVFPLDLPPLEFETHGLWLDIEAAVRTALEEAGRHFMGSIHALEHAAISMFPLFALCDRDDIGGISIPLHPQTGKAAVFIYDGVPGGVGLAERGYEIIEDLLLKVEELLSGCDCVEGCPACVYSPKCGSGNKPLDKEGALLLVRLLLGKEKLSLSSSPPALVISEEPAPPAEEDGSLRYGVLDLETQRLADEVGGWGNSHLMGVSVGVLYDSRDHKFQVFHHNQVEDLLQRLQKLQMVVGFNIKRFDYKVLSAYTPDDLGCLPTLDLLEEVHGHLGFRLSLQALGEATLGAGKSADGLQAVKWWREGEIDKLSRYCQKDVELTRDLLRFGQEEGYLIYQRKDGARLRIPVDWSWPSLMKRFI
ncbi:MAG: DEAD/DEAH box helicase [Desulfarculaceae bacterium]|jgi:DEAD/DEAH box helicase domain-containing protein